MKLQKEIVCDYVCVSIVQEAHSPNLTFF